MSTAKSHNSIYSMVNILFIVIAIGCGGKQNKGGEGGALNQESEEFAFRMAEITIKCLAENPASKGKFSIAANIEIPGEPPSVFDYGSSEGTETAIECTKNGVLESLRSPRGAPGKFIHLYTSLPPRPEDLRFEFPDEVSKEN